MRQSSLWFKKITIRQHATPRPPRLNGKGDPRSFHAKDTTSELVCQMEQGGDISLPGVLLSDSSDPLQVLPNGSKVV
jgi:hypothetical protein